MEPILVILNPAARSEKARRAWEQIALLPGCKILPTTAVGDAQRLAEQAVKDGCKLIVAAGGDGTVNDVVNGIAGSEVTLGVLPVGTMNVFAAELGIPNDLQAAWKIIQKGETRRVDLPQANGKYFVQLAGVGLDAQVVEATSWAFKKSFGPLSYLISAAQIAARKPPKLIVKSEGHTVEGSFVLVGNGRYYGGPLAFFRDARIDDGKLDVLIFKNLGYLDLARYLGTILMGRHTDLSDVEYFQTAELTVTSSEQVPIEVDGEVIGRLPVKFEMSPHALQVLVAAGP